VENGAFALMDCLGFKGIWKRYKDEYPLLMTKLSSISEHAEHAVKNRIYPKEIPVDDIVYDIKIKLLSDSVAVSLSSNKKPLSPIYQLITMTQIVEELTDVFIKDRPQLLLRRNKGVRSTH
jgi:hypothetical protein